MYQEKNGGSGGYAFSEMVPDSDSHLFFERIIHFLEHYGTPDLTGKAFSRIIGGGDGKERWRRLLSEAGYEGHPEAFVTAVCRRLLSAVPGHTNIIEINSVGIPYLLLMTMLEMLIPGNGSVAIRDTHQLEALTRIRIPEQRRTELQSVIDTFPVRLSMHVIRQMRLSPPVARQYLPFVEENDPFGHTHAWVGRHQKGMLEQMYPNRVIFLLNMSCPVYCRFCFRKHKESRQQPNPAVTEIREAVKYVARSTEIKEVLITGGDPFLNRRNMICAVDELMKIPHVQTLRLATRSLAYEPRLFLNRDAGWLRWLKEKNREIRASGKKMEVASHFIHPDEISPESLEIITDLVSNGIPVYIQTPFLKDCNTDEPDLVRLFRLLRGAGAEMHYLFIPCGPIKGNRIYKTSIMEGHRTWNYLRAHLSDRAMPRLCTGTPIGKIDWNASGWAVEPDADDPNYFWIRTPYSPDYYSAFASPEERGDTRINEDGTYDLRYLGEIGDRKLFWGSGKPAAKKKRKKRPNVHSPEEVHKTVGTAPGILPSIIRTGSKTLARVHRTRAEMEAAYHEKDLAYIRKHKSITDAVLTSRKDIADSLSEIEKMADYLHTVPHVNAVRLRSLRFNLRPDRFTSDILQRIGDLNRLTAASPLRLEIETLFLHPDEITPKHKALAGKLRSLGITVYANAALLTGVNDEPETVERLAYHLREIGVEFHHLYIAGHPVQKDWNQKRPVDLADVTEIAGQLRRKGSGREIPRYIILTPLGEADFGVGTRFEERKDCIFARLLPYTLPYFREISPDYEWPEGVTEAEDGHPVVRLDGLVSSDGFMVKKAPFPTS